MDIEQELFAIKERNKKVDLDKRWETNWVRRGFIMLVTYIFAVLWLLAIHESNMWWKAVVPVVGYLLSTLSLPQLKKWYSR